MKHIFLVHSPVTYLVSVSVINELNILKEDAIIIFQEFEKAGISERYTSVSINKFYNRDKLPARIYNYFRYFNVPRRMDRLIDSAIGKEKFTAYIPVLTLIGKSLITHSNCAAFNFIEEGLADYYKEETLSGLTAEYSKESWRVSLTKNLGRVFVEMYLLARGYNFKLQSLPFSYTSYNAFNNVRFFGLTPESFPLVDAKKKVVVPFKEESFASVYQQADFDISNKIVWIGDPGIAQHGFTETVYLNGIKKGCIGFLKIKGESNVFIKFHRNEPDSLREKIKKLFRDNGISIQIIPDAVIMELLLFEAKNVTLIGVYSSLLYYATIMKHTSFSIFEFLKEEYSHTLKNRDFSFYWNSVALIKPSDTNYVEAL
jgi:hypothetical protein